MLSIAQQRCAFDSEVIVVDGASTDDTVREVERFADRIPNLKIISKPDKSHFDAMANGFSQCRGEIQTYINAGDYFFPSAFQTVDAAFRDNEQAKWMTGKKCRLVDGALRPGINPYLDRNVIRCGWYGPILPFLQAEGMFWSRQMNESLDLDYLRDLKIAGEYYMWLSFAKEADLIECDQFLACFSVHEGQISSARSAYLEEMKSFSKKVSKEDLLPILVTMLATTLRATHHKLGLMTGLQQPVPELFSS